MRRSGSKRYVQYCHAIKPNKNQTKIFGLIPSMIILNPVTSHKFPAFYRTQISLPPSLEPAADPYCKQNQFIPHLPNVIFYYQF